MTRQLEEDYDEMSSQEKLDNFPLLVRVLFLVTISEEKTYHKEKPVEQLITEAKEPTEITALVG